MFDTLIGHDGIIHRTIGPADALQRFGTIGNISAILINLVIGIGFGVGILCIALSMVLYVLSGGNPEKTKTAWRAFIYGVIGTMIAIGAFALKNIVVRAIGVDDPNILDVPTF
jgi:hypothetical protein